MGRPGLSSGRVRGGGGRGSGGLGSALNEEVAAARSRARVTAAHLRGLDPESPRREELSVIFCLAGSGAGGEPSLELQTDVYFVPRFSCTQSVTFFGPSYIYNCRNVMSSNKMIVSEVYIFICVFSRRIVIALVFLLLALLKLIVSVQVTPRQLWQILIAVFIEHHKGY